MLNVNRCWARKELKKRSNSNTNVQLGEVNQCVVLLALAARQLFYEKKNLIGVESMTPEL